MAQQSGILSWFANLGTRVGPSATDSKAKSIKNLSNYISPVQLQRERHDIFMWREAISESENAWYPQRVRMQRMYIDTILSGHTLSCVKKRKDLTLLREWKFVDKNGNENADLKELFNKKWFAKFISIALDARFFGYNLVSLGEVENDEFPNLDFIRRWNVSPDRLNVTQFVYSLSGAPFLEKPFSDWHVWIPTDSDTGQSTCGYGELYSVAQYEILARGLLGNNADAAELYGMPMRHVKSDMPNGPERDSLFNSVANMGSNPAIMTGKEDEIDLLESQNGQGYGVHLLNCYHCRFSTNLSVSKRDIC